MKNETILVTGGAGFIGSHLCEALLNLGYAVVNIDNFNDYYDPGIKEANIRGALCRSGYTLIKGDILDSACIKNIFDSYHIDRVIHLAAMAGVRNSILAPLDYVDIDIKGTVNLLSISKDYHIKKFVFASSSSVYGTNSKAPFSEDDPIENQVSPYAAAKRCGEIYCKTYNALYKMPIGCMRFFTVYGPRQRPDMAIHKFVKWISEDNPIQIYGDGTSRRDYTYIDDIVDGLIKAMTVEYDFEIFNLGNSHTIELNDLISLIEGRLGKKAVKNYIGNQQGDVPLTYADIEKPKRILGYMPATSIDVGIENFVEWYKNQKGDVKL